MEKSKVPYTIYSHTCILKEAKVSDEGYRFCLFEEFEEDLFVVERPEVKTNLTFGSRYNVNLMSENKRNGEHTYIVIEYKPDWESGYIDITMIEKDTDVVITYRTKSEEKASKYYIGQYLYGFIDFM